SRNLLPNDSEADAGTPLGAAPAATTPRGTLAITANGAFTYTPAANYNGSDSFTYKASDGTAESNVATVTITITAVNDAPVAGNDTAATAEDTAVAITVLANDTDVDGDALSITATSAPAHGTATA